MALSPTDRVIRTARRRLAGQLLLDRLAVAWLVALAVGLAWLLVEPRQWWIPVTLTLFATVVAFVRTVRDYPARLAAALELDSRFGLRERITAAVTLPRGQRESPVGAVVIANADSHAAGLRVQEKFPLRLRRSAAWVPVLAAMIAVFTLAWNPIIDTNHFKKPDKPKPDDTAKRVSETTPNQLVAIPQPHPKTERTTAERLADLRADLDRLEREVGEKKPDRLANLTATEDAARSIERESLDRLARIESQLKQLDQLAKSPDFKDGPARDAVESLSQGNLEKAEKALHQLAKAAAEKPNDPQLRKQLDLLKDELRKAADNTAAKEKLEKLIEQAKKEGRDSEGLQKELDKLRADAEQSQSLRELAEKLDGASKQLEKGNSAEAEKQLAAAAGAVGEIKKQVQEAQDAQSQGERANRLKDEDAKPNGDPSGIGGVADKPPPMGKPHADTVREVRPRVPLADPKGAMTPAGSGDFTRGFTKTDPAQLGTAIERATRSAPAATAGQPLSAEERAAIREFFERLGK